jgi:hypothetical protein
MTVNLNFTIPDPVQLLVYLAISLVVALLVGGLARMRSGLGYLAAVIMAALGAWFFVSIIHLQVNNEINLAGVPLIEAFIGALIFGLVAVLLFRRRRSDVVVYDE